MALSAANSFSIISIHALHEESDPFVLAWYAPNKRHFNPRSP